MSPDIRHHHSTETDMRACCIPVPLLLVGSLPAHAQRSPEPRFARTTPPLALFEPALGDRPLPTRARFTRDIGYVADSTVGIVSRKRHILCGMLAGYVVAGVASTVSSDGSDFVASLNMMMYLPPALLGGALIGDIVYRVRRDRAQKRRTQPTAHPTPTERPEHSASARRRAAGGSGLLAG